MKIKRKVRIIWYVNKASTLPLSGTTKRVLKYFVEWIYREFKHHCAIEYSTQGSSETKSWLVADSTIRQQRLMSKWKRKMKGRG